MLLKKYSMRQGAYGVLMQAGIWKNTSDMPEARHEVQIPNSAF